MRRFLKFSDKLKNYSIYISQIIHLPVHIAIPRCILSLAKAYLKDIVYGILRYENFFIGLHLHKNCIVRTRGKYFVVRKHTIDLNSVSPLSEAREISILCDKLRKLRKKIEGNNYQIIFIDVGAHIGKYSILFADLVHKVIAIEPDPRNYTVLRYNIKLNKISNVVTLQVAASSRKDRVKLIIDNVYTAHSHVAVGKEETSTHHVIVQALPLDVLLEQLGLISTTMYYVLKIDVEGHEIDVLKGAQRILRKTKIMLVETTYRNLYSLIKLIPRGMCVVAMYRYPYTVNLILTTQDLIA